MFDIDKFYCEERQWCTSTFVKMYGDNELYQELPQYLWKASTYIEQLLLGIAVDYFKLWKNNDIYSVYDGDERLLSVLSYIRDDYELQGLKIRDELNGLKFSQLSRKYQRRITEYNLNIFVIRVGTSQEYRHEIIKAAKI